MRGTKAIFLAALLSFLDLSTANAGNITYFHLDPVGNGVLQSDADGKVVRTVEYRPYGKAELDKPGNGPGFAGHVNDPLSGLTYMRARYYDPTLGRFLGADPIRPIEGDGFGFNRYAYANNNPLKFVDPDGKYAELAVEALSISLGTYSFQQNVNSGDYGAAAVDAAGVVVDAVLAVVPIVPGVVGAGIGAARSGKAIDDLRAAATRAMADGPVTPVIFPARDTRNSANQIRAWTTPEKAKEALLSNGYTQTTLSKDGTASVLSNGRKSYNFYSKSTSTNEPSATLKIEGVRRDTKIRLAGEL